MSKLTLSDVMEKFDETFVGSPPAKPADAGCRTQPAKAGEGDYTQDAQDVEFIQYCIQLGLADLYKREAMYSNGGGWALGRVHGDIARGHRLQELYSRCFEVVMRDCGNE
jgi:hypothetical protein